MISGKFTFTWKITKVLDTPPPIHQKNIVFNLSANTGLYSQFSLPLNLGYVPHFFEPTVVFHQVIKNKLAKQDVKINDKKFPYNIDVPNLDAQVLLNIKIRLYPPNILSLTVTVSGFPSSLDAVELINYQRLEKLGPIYNIIQWTIGMVETLDHKNFNPLQPLRSKSIVYLDIVCHPENFKDYFINNISHFIGILIRNDYYETMNEKIQNVIIQKNENHNLKYPFDKLLIDKQGILYVKPMDTMAPRSQKSQFSKIQDLYEIAIIYSEFLNNYLSFRIQNEDLADFFLYKIRPWIKDPEVVFKDSLEHKNMWKLLLNEFELKAQMQSILNPALESSIEERSMYFNIFSVDWWNERDLASLLTNKIEESKYLQLQFLGDEDLKRIIIEDYIEARRSLHSNNYKATILLCGSIAEAILATIIDKKLPNNYNINTLKFYKMIEITRDEGLVTDKNIINLIDTIRNYRNLIHPGVQIRKSISPDLQKATIALEVINLLIIDLNKTQQKQSP